MEGSLPATLSPDCRIMDTVTWGYRGPACAGRTSTAAASRWAGGPSSPRRAAWPPRAAPPSRPGTVVDRFPSIGLLADRSCVAY